MEFELFHDDQKLLESVKVRLSLKPYKFLGSHMSCILPLMNRKCSIYYAFLLSQAVRRAIFESNSGGNWPFDLGSDFRVCSESTSWNHFSASWELWNNNIDEFQKENIWCNTRSRLRILDGRSLSPGKVLPLLPNSNSLNERTDRSLFAPTKYSSVPTVSNVEQVK